MEKFTCFMHLKNQSSVRADELTQQTNILEISIDKNYMNARVVTPDFSYDHGSFWDKFSCLFLSQTKRYLNNFWCNCIPAEVFLGIFAM